MAPIDGECPANAPIKGNVNSMIYHRPGQEYYDITVAEGCFVTAAGRRSGRLPGSQGVTHDLARPDCLGLHSRGRDQRCEGINPHPAGMCPPTYGAVSQPKGPPAPYASSSGEEKAANPTANQGETTTTNSFPS